MVRSRRRARRAGEASNDDGSGERAPEIPSRECVSLHVRDVEGSTVLLVPARGLPGSFLQLDTGADRSVLYGDAARAASGPVGVFSRRSIVPASRAELTVDSAPGLGRVVGTAGTDVLAGSVLVFDPVGRELCAGDRAPPGTWVVPSRFENGKAFVSLSMAGRTLADLAFDTGAQFGLVVDRGDLEEMTGVRTEDPTNRRTKVTAWGETLVVVVAPARADVALGGRSLARLEVATIESRPDAFAKVRRFRLRGLLGWPALGGRAFALDLRAGGGG